MAAFPQELHHRVCSFLVNDSDALFDLALVNKAFGQAASSLLWQHVELDYDLQEATQRKGEFRCRADQNKWVKAERSAIRTQQFFAFAEDRPHLLLRIRSLVARRCEYILNEGGIDSAAAKLQNAATFLKALSLCRNLETLDFDCFENVGDPAVLAPLARPLPAACFPRLRTLALQSANGPVLTFLSRAPELEELTLKSGLLLVKDPIDDCDIPHPSKISAVHRVWQVPHYIELRLWRHTQHSLRSLSTDSHWFRSGFVPGLALQEFRLLRAKQGDVALFEGAAWAGQIQRFAIQECESSEVCVKLVQSFQNIKSFTLVHKLSSAKQLGDSLYAVLKSDSRPANLDSMTGQLAVPTLPNTQQLRPTEVRELAALKERWRILSQKRSFQTPVRAILLHWDGTILNEVSMSCRQSR